MSTAMAKTSARYVAEAQRNYRARGGRKLSDAEKRVKIAQLLRSGGIDKVAAAQVGAIVVRLAYEGVVRSLLVEDFVEPGRDPMYDVMDDWGAAYQINSHGGRVKIERIEGRRIRPTWYRIAAEWEVPKEDVSRLSANALEYAEDQTFQRIMEREDSDFFALVEAGLQTWTDRHTGQGTDNQAVENPNVLVEASGSFTLNTFLEASARIATQRLAGANLVMHPADVYDIYKWDVTVVGLQFKEEYIAGNKQVHFGDYRIIESVMVPRGTAYLLPDSKYVGYFTLFQGLEQQDDPTGVSSFMVRKVYDELVAMLLLNQNGLTKITKS